MSDQTVHDARPFGIGVVLSLTTGVLVDEFSGLHGLVEYLCGHSVWIHELGSVGPVGSCVEEIHRQRPDLARVQPPSFKDVPRDRREAACKAWVAAQADEHGETVWLVGGLAAQRAKDPLETLIDLVGPDRVMPIVLSSDVEGDR